jgi:hypothetical protein
MRFAARSLVAAIAGLACLAVQAANDRFFKESPESRNGFFAARDPLYVKECGSCHFPYPPGLLPARSWELHLARLEKHFGESVSLPAQSQAALRNYLVENAADKSPFEGSRTIMERIDPAKTPYRFWDVPLFREMHRIIASVIDRKPRIKVRNLTNCNGCHLGAESGSFGYEELVVPGLTVMRNKP